MTTIVGPPRLETSRMSDFIDTELAKMDLANLDESIKVNWDVMFVYPRIVTAKLVDTKDFPRKYRMIVHGIADWRMEWDLIHWAGISMEYLVEHDRLDLVKVLFEALGEKGVAPRQLEGREHSIEWFDRYDMRYGWISFEDEHQCLRGLKVSPTMFGVVEGFLYPN
jgi:hypothetical protein